MSLILCARCDSDRIRRDCKAPSRCVDCGSYTECADKLCGVCAKFSLRCQHCRSRRIQPKPETLLHQHVQDMKPFDDDIVLIKQENENLSPNLSKLEILNAVFLEYASESEQSPSLLLWFGSFRRLLHDSYITSSSDKQSKQISLAHAGVIFYKIAGNRNSLTFKQFVCACGQLACALSKRSTLLNKALGNFMIHHIQPLANSFCALSDQTLSQVAHDDQCNIEKLLTNHQSNLHLLFNNHAVLQHSNNIMKMSLNEFLHVCRLTSIMPRILRRSQCVVVFSKYATRDDDNKFKASFNEFVQIIGVMSTLSFSSTVHMKQYLSHEERAQLLLSLFEDYVGAFSFESFQRMQQETILEAYRSKQMELWSETSLNTVCNVYEIYAREETVSANGSITIATFIRIIMEAKQCAPNIAVQLDRESLTLLILKQITGEKGKSHTRGGVINLQRFAAAIVDLALDAYPGRHSAQNALNEFVNNLLHPLLQSKQSTKNQLPNVDISLESGGVCDILYQNEKQLKQIFREYSSISSNNFQIHMMSLDQLLKFSRRFDIIPNLLSRRQVEWMHRDTVRLRSVNGFHSLILKNDNHQLLNYDEFIDLITRMSTQALEQDRNHYILNLLQSSSSSLTNTQKLRSFLVYINRKCSSAIMIDSFKMTHEIKIKHNSTIEYSTICKALESIK